MLCKLILRRRGSVLIWVVLLALLLIAMVGLAVDVAYALWVGHQLQVTADAAALAGALQVRKDVALAQQAPIDVALSNSAGGDPVQLVANPANDPAGDVVIGTYLRTTRVFTPTLSAANAVKVVARRTDDSAGGPVSLLFGPLFGVTDAELSRWAIAVSGGGSRSGVIVLSPTDQGALEMHGDAMLAVPGRGIQVNSAHTQAFHATGTVMIDASDLDVTGNVGIHGSFEFGGDLHTGVRPKMDPLAWLPAPTWDLANDLGGISITEGTADLEPGYYSGGIEATGGTINLAPGVYILDGVGLDVGGNTNLYGEGVMFYITGTGYVDLTGTGVVYLTPPDRALHPYDWARIYEGVTFFQDRSNTNPARIIGTSSLDINGTMYFPNNHTKLGGTGGSFGNSLVCYTLDVIGTGQVTVDYDERYPMPGGGAYLVG